MGMHLAHHGAVLACRYGRLESYRKTERGDMVKRIVLLALALVLLASASASADSAYMPTLQREAPRSVDVHAQVTFCKDLSLPLDGFTVSVWDGDELLGAGITDAQGRAVFAIAATPVVTVRFEGSQYVEPQEVTLIAEDAPLFVGVWAKSRYFVQCSGMATNWEQAR